jgi:hypothetical protein
MNMNAPRKTYDICGDCWADVEPDQYFPEATRYGTCAVCHCAAYVIRHAKRVVTRGSKALYVYPVGDCDEAVVLSLNMFDAVVMLTDGETIACCPEDIGVGTDDTILGICDNGEMI